ncbi:glycerol acyltransferase [bacterium]|nr:MAG: glycerol acyltransferase [bacterium]
MNIPILGDKVPKRGNKLSELLGKTILRVMGWRMEGEIPNLPKFLAIAAPHTTNWDFILGMSALMAMNIRVHWLGKNTIFTWPVRYVWQWLGGRPVDRSKAHGVVEQIVQMFKDGPQFILGLSPEGTRKDMPKWRSGFYHIATGASVPILMAYFDFERKVLGIGPLFYPTGDMDKDIESMQNYYKPFTGKYRKSWQA